MGRRATVTKLCSIGGCNKPVSARDWCDMHLSRWRRHGDPLAIPAIAEPGTRSHNRRVEFTPALWEKWMSRSTIDARTLHLRRGIEQLRSSLERIYTAGRRT